MNKGIFVLLATFCITAFAQVPINERFADSPVRIIDDVKGVSMILAVDDLFYSPIRPIIRADYFETLNEVVDTVNDYPKVKILISGHTDQVMTREQRLEFSEKYAEEVANYLLTRGVDPNRIVRVSGESSYLPVEDNWTRLGRHLNRRVEVTLASAPETWNQNCDHCMQIPQTVGEIE